MLRHPIARVVSAFRLRYSQVVKNKIKGLPGEYKTLSKYQTIDNIAKSLYFDNGVPNKKALKEIKNIHHIKEDIDYYIGHLIDKCDKDQIFGVLTQENLNKDIENVFGYINKYKERVMPAFGEDKTLSEQGFKNLIRYLEKDYRVVCKLFGLEKIKKDYFFNCFEKI